MADEKKEVKETPVTMYRAKLMDRPNLQANILEGLKSKSGKIRSLAIKAAFKLKDHKFLKANILPLIAADKSKKVLRTISKKMTRKDLAKKVRAFTAKKKASGGAAKPAEGAPAA